MNKNLVNGFCDRITKLAEQGKWFDEKSLTRHEKSVLRTEATNEARKQFSKDQLKKLRELKSLRKEMVEMPNYLLFNDLGAFAGMGAGALLGKGVATGAAIGTGKFISPLLSKIPKIGPTLGAFAPAAAYMGTAAPIALIPAIAARNLGRKLDEKIHGRKITDEMLGIERKYKGKYEDTYFDPDFRKRVYESMQIMGGGDVDY
jgi:hypothetical protein